MEREREVENKERKEKGDEHTCLKMGPIGESVGLLPSSQCNLSMENNCRR